MTDPRTEQLDQRELRLTRAIGILPYGALAVSVGLAVGTRIPGTVPLSQILALSGVALVWLLLRSGLDQRAKVRALPGWVAVAHFAGLLALLVLLNLGNPLYGFFGFAGYLHAMRYLTGGLRIAGIVLNAFPVALSQTGGRIPDSTASALTFFAVLSFNLLVAGMLMSFGMVVESQAVHHRRSAVELADANLRLAGMLEENSGLHAQLLMQAREAGAADERQRMAREIHDTVAQGLAGIVTQLQAAEHGAEPGARARHLENAAQLARDSLGEARRAVSALRPIQLQDAELPDALGEIVDRWRELHGIRADLTVTGSPRPMHPEVEVTLLRAAQEALANAGKHARASRVGLTLSYMADVVTLDVRDDGRGFDPALPAPGPASTPGPGSSSGSGSDTGADGGYGLLAMRQRVQRLAGRLEIESEPGGGTAISATVPAIPLEEHHA